MRGDLLRKTRITKSVHQQKTAVGHTFLHVRQNSEGAQKKTSFRPIFQIHDRYICCSPYKPFTMLSLAIALGIFIAAVGVACVAVSRKKH